MKNYEVPPGFYKQLHYLKLDLREVRKRLVEPLNKVVIIFYNGERIKLIRRSNGHWIYKSPFLVNYDLTYNDELKNAQRDLIKVIAIRNNTCCRCKNPNPMQLTSKFNDHIPICNECYNFEILESIQGAKFDESNKYYL